MMSSEADLTERLNHGVSTRMRVQLRDEAAGVGDRGVLADEECSCDFSICQSVRNQVKNFALAVTDRLTRPWRPTPARGRDIGVPCLAWFARTGCDRDGRDVAHVWAYRGSDDRR